MVDYFVGVDVQTARPCPYSVLDVDGSVIDAGWLQSQPTERCVAELRTLLSNYGNDTTVVGIDAPRCPLPGPRQWYWSGHHWVPHQHQVGNGRHCEVVISAHHLANPQWTPCEGPFPEWMSLGFALFRELGSQFTLHEVFPSASYAMLKDDTSVVINARAGDFFPHPKDMLDAYVAAATLREFAQNRGCEVGGGDGLGTIVLPRKLPNPISRVLAWPTDDGIAQA